MTPSCFNVNVWLKMKVEPMYEKILTIFVALNDIHWRVDQ